VPNKNENGRAYAFAHLGGNVDLGLVRLRGVGLGNMLFPWARYVVGAKKLNLRKIAPTWPQVSERSWIRNETDKRWYGDLFRVMPDEITGPPRLWNLGTLNRRPEEEAWKFARDGRSVILFSGIKDYFNDVLNEHTTVREALLQLTNPKLLRPLTEGYRPAIAVHVRLGDFKPPEAAATMVYNTRIPLDWYLRVIQGLRSHFGELQVDVFSDGSDEELRSLMALSGVTRKTFGSSIGDILALSSSAILVTSRSTFSMWASYLGRQPVVWYPGRLFQRLLFDHPEAEIESSGEFSRAFLNYCHESLLLKGHATPYVSGNQMPLPKGF
jgi:Glycosyl transferase family 11